MQLTNYSFLDSRKNYISSLSQQKIASDRVSTGNRFENAGTDVGALGQNARLRSNRLQMQSKRVAMQNFNTFLDTQQKTLQQVRGIYERMSSLAHQALDPTLTESSSGKRSDKDLLNTEFNVLASELDSILDRKVNGQLIFGGTSADFTQGLSDTNNFPPGYPDDWPQRITKDVMTTSGEITVELCPGQAEDQIWVFQGELPQTLDKYFAPGTVNNSELTDELYKIFDKQGIFTTGKWQTVGNSSLGRFDKFAVNFNTCDVSITPEFHPANAVSPFPAGGGAPTDAQLLAANVNGLFGEELYRRLTLDGTLKTNAPDGSSTKITMIGINTDNTFTYEVKAKFEPSLPYNDIEVPTTGEVYQAISFGKIECSNINNSEKALKVLSNLEAEIANLTNSMAQVASSQRRYESEINHMENTDVFNESALGRISDTDYAKESTQLAKESIRMGLATQVMSNTTRLTDVLIPLTTNHFRGEGLSSTL